MPKRSDFSSNGSNESVDRHKNHEFLNQIFGYFFVSVSSKSENDVEGKPNTVIVKALNNAKTPKILLM